MPAIQPLPVTEIGIRMPSIGRGNFQNIYQYKILIIIFFFVFKIYLYGFQVIFQSTTTVMVSGEFLFYFPAALCIGNKNYAPCNNTHCVLLYF